MSVGSVCLNSALPFSLLMLLKTIQQLASFYLARSQDASKTEEWKSLSKHTHSKHTETFIMGTPNKSCVCKCLLKALKHIQKTPISWFDGVQSCVFFSPGHHRPRGSSSLIDNSLLSSLGKTSWGQWDLHQKPIGGRWCWKGWHTNLLIESRKSVT